ncbi:PTS sugar transporter subunit IIB [Klebsiella spallanzanii]|uniref:PTS system cellobiose-specific EIIB component n=1 Tax=Klebsiella spallanzanii TaxID=2587528 RepID=A0A564HCE3_9ENTR|nr:PTS cellobiose transporter subunit IIB [Klebsiella spallanzanii]VUS30171.1 PTS system cellobiose-specific EIIB component [Klebsiella spallanzanii]
MKKLLICCLFGETAGILARKMQKIADIQKLDLLISAVGVENFFSIAPAYDGVLVAPHIQYKIEEFINSLNSRQEIAVIESLPYASFDGEKILSFALNTMPQSLS